jgi:hypothetical protein
VALFCLAQFRGQCGSPDESRASTCPDRGPLEETGSQSRAAFESSDKANPTPRPERRYRQKPSATPSSNHVTQTLPSENGFMPLFFLAFVFLLFLVAQPHEFLVVFQTQHLGRFLLFLFSHTQHLGRIHLLQTEQLSRVVV